MTVFGSARRALGVAVLALVANLATGCLFHRDQLNVVNLQEKVAGIHAGTTTLEELETLIGPATSITPIGAKRLHVYPFSDAKTAGLALIILNISKTNVGYDTALFLVDENDVVEDFVVSTNSKDLPWQWWAFGD